MKLVKKLLVEKFCSYEGCKELATCRYHNQCFCSEHYFLTRKIKNESRKSEKLKELNSMEIK